MPELVPMPKLGFDMAEGTLVRKVKQDGEAVKKGEVLAEIETDKATVEVEAPASGVVKGWVIDEGQAVPVGALMAIIGAPDEQVDVAALKASAGNAQGGAIAKAAAEELPQDAAGAAASKPGAGPAQAEVLPQKQNGKPPAGAAPEVAPAAGGGAPASPIARKMASEAGIDIQQIPGTGPGGRITKKDVEQFLSRPQPAAAVAAPAAPTVSGQDQEVPLSRLRQLIARRMTESKQTVPQFYVNTEVDMAAAMELRKQLNSFVPEERKLSVNDFIIKAAALALRDFPNLNASFGGDKVVHKGRVNIGNAVAIEGGLLTVVVKDADQKSMGQIAAEMKAMVGRVRAGKVQGGDIEGSTFSVSNLGMYDVDHFIAIINPPEAAILATGAVKQVPVIKDGAVAPGQRMLATVSADHRVTDGAEAARFLQVVKQYLEEPMRLLL